MNRSFVPTPARQETERQDAARSGILRPLANLLFLDVGCYLHLLLQGALFYSIWSICPMVDIWQANEPLHPFDYIEGLRISALLRWQQPLSLFSHKIPASVKMLRPLISAPKRMQLQKEPRRHYVYKIHSTQNVFVEQQASF